MPKMVVKKSRGHSGSYFATLMMMVTVETITDDDGCGFIKAIISNNFTQICWVATPNRYPTAAQIFLMFLQSLLTGNSTNSLPIQTDSFNIWTKTCESNTKRG